ncbi:MAG: hypothetical protein IPN86_04755 [Saprospiraceae bacterium]|nr:hypothetical protein [Saprospiraceae bacterium]
MPGYAESSQIYRYKRWLGLYEEAEKFLYVNRGFLVSLGFPGRIGMWRVTLIELRSGEVIG